MGNFVMRLDCIDYSVSAIIVQGCKYETWEPILHRLEFNCYWFVITKASLLNRL